MTPGKRPSCRVPVFVNFVCVNGNVIQFGVFGMSKCVAAVRHMTFVQLMSRKNCMVQTCKQYDK